MPKPPVALCRSRLKLVVVYAQGKARCQVSCVSLQAMDISPTTEAHYRVLREDAQKIANGHLTLCSSAISSLECVLRLS